uniref:hypothetical protein n=1 Tax=Neisseria meningitidis TaxID=487 RepID=UPI001C86A9C1
MLPHTGLFLLGKVALQMRIRPGVNKFHDIFLQKVFGGNGWSVFQTTAEHPKISLSKIRIRQIR